MKVIGGRCIVDRGSLEAVAVVPSLVMVLEAGAGGVGGPAFLEKLFFSEALSFFFGALGRAQDHTCHGDYSYDGDPVITKIW